MGRRLERGGARFGLRGLIAQAGGARLCFGKPVRQGEHVVIPVARVRVIGGGGFGSGPQETEGSGGGGGGAADAAPVGFIEVGPAGARFEAIPDPAGTARALRTGAAAITTVVGALAGAAALRRRLNGPARGPIGLLRR
jgi:uncharacterized spore protein YtfJ